MDELTETERRALEAWTPHAPAPDFADRVFAARGLRASHKLIAGLALAVVAAAAIVIVVLRMSTSSEPQAPIAGSEGPHDRIHVQEHTPQRTGEPPAERGVAPAPAPVPAPAPSAPVDVLVTAGDSFTLHDPRGQTMVQFDFHIRCPNGVIEVDRDDRYTAPTRTTIIKANRDGPFTAPTRTTGAGRATVPITTGSWIYRLRCVTATGDGPPIATGRIVSRTDAPDRALPALPALNTINADARSYRISYQREIPTVEVRTKRKGTHYRLHMLSDGRLDTYDSTSPSIKVPGAKLHDGAYTFFVEVDGVRDVKDTKLAIDFDHTAPVVHIVAPHDGDTWTDEIELRGELVPGWSIRAFGMLVPLGSGSGRFMTKFSGGPAKTLALELRHRTHGVHYYILRAK